MTEEKMRAFCKEVVPEIEKIKEIIEKHNINDRVAIAIFKDGTVFLNGGGKDLNGWDLTKLKNNPYEVWRHGKGMPLDKE